MPRKKTTFNKNIIFAIVLIMLGILVTVQTFQRALRRIAGDFYYPFLNVPVKTEGFISNQSLLLKRKTKLVSALEKLMKENAELKTKLVTLADLRRENQDLRRLMKLSEQADYQCVFAEVIQRDPVNWNKHFIVNKGISNGITPGAIALTYAKIDDNSDCRLVVVGRVAGETDGGDVSFDNSSIGKHTAVINTLMNEQCRLSVYLPDVGATGIISGGGYRDGASYALIKYLPKDKIFKAGGNVFTSGLSRWTPSGLYVGQLTGEQQVASNIHNKLYKEAAVKPAVDFEHLKYIIILNR